MAMELVAEGVAFFDGLFVLLAFCAPIITSVPFRGFMLIAFRAQIGPDIVPLHPYVDVVRPHKGGITNLPFQCQVRRL